MLLFLFMKVLSKPDQKLQYLPFIKERAKTKSIVEKSPNIYLQSRKRKSNNSSLGSSNHIYEYIKNSGKSHSRQILRQLLTKNIAFDHIENTQTKFLSEDIVNSVLEPIKALNYKSSEFGIVIQMVQDIFGDDFSISSKEILAGQGKITKKLYVFFTSTYYRPFSFCCNAPIYISIFKANQVQEIFKNPIEKSSVENDYRIDFICSECKKKVLKLREVKPTQLLASRQSQKSIEVVDQERKKICMTILIASGRYKKMRINQSKDNLRYADSRNKGYDGQSTMLENVKKVHSKRIRSQVLDHNEEYVKKMI